VLKEIVGYRILILFTLEIDKDT